ncbi:Structural maintenance of chromosomes protein 6 [Pichia californica]|uniref:Structural maintenance of chromosomes protein 6 n=1 Tax=Pichia californica TaxID=460514 RepID=A0A9P6WLZ9_9ASCO|nr:Structural maintenance of chromosomes protein 6 [[Candida] californica]
MTTRTERQPREQSFIDAVDNETNFTPMSNVSTETNPTPSSNRKRSREDEAALLTEAISNSKKSLKALNSSQINVEQAMTQVDSRWNKDRKRRKRTMGKMTQVTPSIKSDITDDSPSEAGVIEKLDLFNFMCHTAFSLNFGPQTNFIIGRNGSGKSAVLTGISVALGAKATDTDRGNSLKNLIMHGKNVARAIVTLKNDGKEAYKPEEYGNKIIIERVLKSDGQHQLHIKNVRNKLISNKKKTVDQILEYFGITIANPMTILTQTEAKTFLAHSTDKDKFNSFMAGTRLKESFENFKDIQKNADEIRDLLNKNQDVEQELQEKLNNASQVWHSFQDSAKYNRKKEILLGKQVWVEFEEKQKMFSKADEIIKTKSAEIIENQRQISSISQLIVDAATAKSKLEGGELENLKRKYIECESEVTSYRDIVNSAQNESRELRNAISNVQTKIDENNEVIKDYNKKIKEEEKKIQGSSQESIEKIKLFQEKQKEKEIELNTEKDEYSSNLEIMKGEGSDLDQKYKNVLAELNNNVRTLENKYRDSKNQDHSNRPESSFNSQMNSLMKDLRSQRFQNSVSGPLGMHIELKKEFHKWGPVLETTLSRALIGFLASNHQDANILSSRVKFFGTGSEITVRQPEVFNFEQFKPKSKYPSILDVLKIDDDNLKCFLVDALKIHSTLLIPNRIDAQTELEADYSNLISSVFCLVDNNVLKVFKKNGALQSDPVHLRRNNQARLRVEGDSLTARLERDLRLAQNERDEKQNEYNEKKNYIKSELKKLQTRVNEIKFQIRDIGKIIEKTNDKLENMSVGTTKLETLIETRDNLEADTLLEVQRLEPLNVELSNSHTSVQTQVEVYKSIVKDAQTAKKLYNNKIKELSAFDSNIEFNKSSIRDFENKNAKLNSDVKKLSDYLAQTSAVIKSLETEALQYCTLNEANITPNDTAASINEEIRNINIYLEDIERKQGISKERAELNLIEAHNQLKSFSTKYSETIQMSTSLQSALKFRLENLLQTTFLIFQEVESVFVSALRIRGFRGKIEFNVNKGTLTLKVATKETAPLRSVESFSGGEKSYGQIAFLFAIWGPMHSRVRGLDEFDVFMDNVNRRLALKLILSKVAENPKRQTIFITPLGVANIEGLDKKSVNIHEISPPERANI